MADRLPDYCPRFLGGSPHVLKGRGAREGGVGLELCAFSSVSLLLEGISRSQKGARQGENLALDRLKITRKKGKELLLRCQGQAAHFSLPIYFAYGTQGSLGRTRILTYSEESPHKGHSSVLGGRRTRQTNSKCPRPRRRTRSWTTHLLLSGVLSTELVFFVFSPEVVAPRQVVLDRTKTARGRPMWSLDLAKMANHVSSLDDDDQVRRSWTHSDVAVVPPSTYWTEIYSCRFKSRSLRVLFRVVPSRESKIPRSRFSLRTSSSYALQLSVEAREGRDLLRIVEIRTARQGGPQKCGRARALPATN